jgi:hypothetical protein
VVNLRYTVHNLASMINSKKIEFLKRLIEKSSEIVIKSSSDPTFKVWKNNVERTLMKVFGTESHEVNEFKKLNFFYNPMMYTLGSDFTNEHFRCFNRDFDMTIKQINSYIEELEEELLSEPEDKQQDKIIAENLNKVFISHSTKDSIIVEEMIEILETVGLKTEQIFCSSFEGYGIDLGEDFLERLKTELDSNVLVIFILSENFYSSPVSLCEMGATWIKTNVHIPVLIPPFDFKDIKGVIPMTQGFKINEALKLNLFKLKIEELFCLSPIDFSTWERKRDRIISRIEKDIK